MQPLQNPPFCSSTVFIRVNPYISLLGSVLLRERYEGTESRVQGAPPAGDGQAGGGRVPARETGQRLKGPSHENICLSYQFISSLDGASGSNS
jgi:hypothetical protein